MKRILITGSNGFVGSFLCEEARKRGFEVYAGIRKSANRKFLPEGVIVLEMDYSSPDSIIQGFTSHRQGKATFDYVIHNAGVTKALNKEIYHRVNVSNTRNLIEALKSYKPDLRKFIFVSSLAAFGPADYNNPEPVSLNSTPHPITEYGKSKLEAEKFLIADHSFPYLIFRPTGIYGPRDHDFLQFFKLVNHHLSLLIGSEENQLTFIYIKDFTRLILDAIESPISGKGYFVSDGNIYSRKEFMTIVKTTLNRKTITLNVPVPLIHFFALLMEVNGRLSGKIPTLNRGKIPELFARSWACDMKPVIEDFDFRPKYDLIAGLRETITWYKNEKWL